MDRLKGQGDYFGQTFMTRDSIGFTLQLAKQTDVSTTQKQSQSYWAYIVLSILYLVRQVVEKAISHHKLL